MDPKGFGKTIIDFLTGNLLFYVFYYPRKYYVEREVFFANEFNVPISYYNFRRFINEITGLSNIGKYEISITDDIAQDPNLLLSLLKADPIYKKILKLINFINLKIQEQKQMIHHMLGH